MTFNPQPKPSAKPKKPGAFRKAAKAVKPVKGTATAQEQVAEKAEEPEAKKAKVAQPSTGQTKGALIQYMLRGAGATSKELEAATGWAPHSVRGYLGTLRAKGVKVLSVKLPKQPTVYRIEAEEVL
jgi:hypothetical protein